jgi:predicted transcriptional regulator
MKNQVFATGPIRGTFHNQLVTMPWKGEQKKRKVLKTIDDTSKFLTRVRNLLSLF